MTEKLQTIAGYCILLGGWKRNFVAFIVGALSALALPPFQIFPVMFLTMPTLVWLLDGASTEPAKTWWQRIGPFFKVGWFFGFGFHLAGFWWVGNAFLVEAETFLWLLPFAVIALPMVLALFLGAACILARPFWGESWRRLFILAAVLAVGEYARGTLFTGLPWNLLGYSATATPIMMQTASLIGIYGITLISIPVFAVLGVVTASEKSSSGATGLIIFAVLIAGFHVGFGYFRLAEASNDSVEKVRLRLVQPAIEQKEKWLPEKEAEIFKRYLDLSTTEIDGQGLSGVTHLIWPESAFPFLLTQRRDALAAIAAMLPDGTNLITGASRTEPPLVAGNEPIVFNSVYLIDSEGLIEGAVDKVHLVPFGEYLPLQRTMESYGFQQLTRLRGGFTAGNRRTVLQAESGPPFLPLICYEIIFPGQVIRGNTEAKWIINVTNDAWFGYSPGPFQHHHQSIVRGVEEGLPVIRVANNGISSVTDSYGRTRQELELGSYGAIDSLLPVAVEKTLFATFGNLLFYGLVFGYFCIGVVGRK